ncbi:MAG TPA: hypothetical protein VGG77_07015, partial [Roseiarcus sp.]
TLSKLPSRDQSRHSAARSLSFIFRSQRCNLSTIGSHDPGLEVADPEHSAPVGVLAKRAERDRRADDWRRADPLAQLTDAGGEIEVHGQARAEAAAKSPVRKFAAPIPQETRRAGRIVTKVDVGDSPEFQSVQNENPRKVIARGV